MKEYKIIDLINYFADILDNGGVSGTDFELSDEEIEIYKTTIISLAILL